MRTWKIISFALSFIAIFTACRQREQTHRNHIVKTWVTTPDEHKLLRHDTILFTDAVDDTANVIHINTSQEFQNVEGFGYTLTGGSAMLINKMNDERKQTLLMELFGNNDDALGISYLRISLGASDLSPYVFSYDDLPPGLTDTALVHFSLGPDTVDLIPILRRIVSINPRLKIISSPWSAPAWMKENTSSVGGSLNREHYAVYAQYFVRYILQMQDRGIIIDAITPQNEPHHGGNNPSMVMSAEEQALFIKEHLGPAFASAGIKTKIVIWDHNCDEPDFPMTILSDAEANIFIHGSAFHLYAGEVSAMSLVRNAYPNKALYFTEQWTGGKENFDNDFHWHLKHVIIGTMRNWSRIALEWNLASDPEFSIHTPGGCTECKGALTIDGDSVTKNVSYYIIAHASRFVPPGSVRVASTYPPHLPNVAFITPTGQTVLIVLNDGRDEHAFHVGSGSNWFMAELEPGAAATYVW